MSHDSPYKHLILTPLKLAGLSRAAGYGVVKKLLEKEQTVEKWNQSRRHRKKAILDCCYIDSNI
jgi:large subunit ribosomal protein L14e